MQVEARRDQGDGGFLRVMRPSRRRPSKGSKDGSHQRVGLTCVVLIRRVLGKSTFVEVRGTTLYGSPSVGRCGLYPITIERYRLINMVIRMLIGGELI